MFEDKQLPADWDRTPKSTRQWAGHTFAIALHVYKHFFFTYPGNAVTAARSCRPGRMTPCRAVAGRRCP